MSDDASAGHGMHSSADGPLPPQLEAAVAHAVAEALDMYRKGHSVDEATAREATADFTQFYFAALARGCPGIRWNFAGCILCTTNVPKSCHRILVFGKDVLRATGGRPVGTDLCRRHHDELRAMPDSQALLEQAALNRVTES